MIMFVRSQPVLETNDSSSGPQIGEISRIERVKSTTFQSQIVKQSVLRKPSVWTVTVTSRDSKMYAIIHQEPMTYAH